ncbi:MAG: glycosyltransferase, partial [Proteobacteria bacterium]|nr:glycosyltransferase [Pseudomonadota bacterium]
MDDAGINRVSLIVPVFNGYADLMRCLASLKTSLSHNRAQVSILLVDDASSDQRIAPLLSNFVGQVSVPVRVTCNATNLG